MAWGALRARGIMDLLRQNAVVPAMLRQLPHHRRMPVALRARSGPALCRMTMPQQQAGTTPPHKLLRHHPRSGIPRAPRRSSTSHSPPRCTSWCSPVQPRTCITATGWVNNRHYHRRIHYNWCRSRSTAGPRSRSWAAAGRPGWPTPTTFRCPVGQCQNTCSSQPRRRSPTRSSCRRPPKSAWAALICPTGGRCPRRGAAGSRPSPCAGCEPPARIVVRPLTQRDAFSPTIGAGMTRTITITRRRDNQPHLTGADSFAL